MMGNYQVRFGGGRMEKGAAGYPSLPLHYGLTNPGIRRYLASRLPNFLQLEDSYSEKDLEAAILREIEAFLLELGVGFTFVARQKRITIDNEDYYIDLLFFHRKLRRLVAVELKLDAFRAADKGQLEKHVELLQLDRSGIRVAT